MSRSLLCIVLVVGVGLCAAPLRASTFLTAEFREVVAEAALIVRGRVTDVRALRGRTGDVESAITLAVDVVLKGSADRFVSVRLPGGTIGRYRTVMTGAPTLHVGEHAVVFLKRGPTGAWWPVGLSQGVYPVTGTARGGLPVVAAPVVAGVTTKATGRVVRGDPRRGALPVRDFESLVRLLVAAGPRAGNPSGGR